jgi:hypothetical protein
MELVTNIVNKAKNFIGHEKASVFSKTIHLYQDDIFLVSFPKSGNTWLSFIIANLLKKDNENINFHNVINYIPELGIHNQKILNLNRPRIIKSHDTYNSQFSVVIYLVRDPRDVYVSYYHYKRKLLPESQSFSEFLRKNDLYPCRWHTHVESWMDKSNVALFLKYEDILADTFGKVCKVAEVILGNVPSDERIWEAIENSSFNKMKAIEKEYGRPFKSRAQEIKSSTFVRKGTIGDWNNHFTEEDKEYLGTEVGSLLEILGYAA